MARTIKSIFARHAAKQSMARRIQNGHLAPKGGKFIGSLDIVRSDLDARNVTSLDSKSSHARSYIRGEHSGHFGSADQSAKQPFQNDVFASEAEYDRSIASVITRIKSGEVKPIEPDPE